MSSAVPSAPDVIEQAAPLNPREADALFKDLSEVDALCLGVSGGPDSLALLFLFNDWRTRSGWSGDATVLTVDHGLRAESAAEAEHVSGLCAGLNLPHHTLVWHGPKPTSNLQAEARTARYALMASWMQSSGIDSLLLAHHKDDQIETFFDRLTRGSGVYGLGGMSRRQRNGPFGLHLRRPFLEISRKRLVAELVDRGVRWCDDPSNLDHGYKRVRLRKLVEGLEEEGLDFSRLSETIQRLRRAGDALDHWVEQVWHGHVTEHIAGPLVVQVACLRELPLEIRLRFLARLILRVTGRETPLRLAKLEHLERRILDEEMQVTLSGAIVLHRSGQLMLWKEAGRRPPETLDSSKVTRGIWDRRYEFSFCLGQSQGALHRRYLGPVSAAPGLPSDQGWSEIWPKAAFACAPALWCDEELLYVPGLYRAPVIEPASVLELNRLPSIFQ